MIVGKGALLKANMEIPGGCIDRVLLRTIERKRREI